MLPYIAVPSYKRPLVFKSNTYNLLKGIPLKKFLFLESEEQKKEYEEAMDLKEYEVIVTYSNGIAEKRNCMRSFFYMKKEDLKVLYIDDDIRSFSKKSDNKTVTIGLADFIYDGFAACEKFNLKIWGINTLNNGLFLKHTITTHLKYIQGGLLGEVFKSAFTSFPYTGIDHYEDFDFTLQYYLRDGGVVRLNDICMETKPWRNGGINDSLGGLEKRRETMKPNSEYLAKKFGPKLITIKEKKWGLEPVLNFRHKHQFKICIPSLGRAQLLNDTTLELIRHLNVEIYIFLTNHIDFLNYKDIIGKGFHYILDTKCVGIGNIRTKIRNYFPTGTKIIMLDDDLTDIKQKTNPECNLYNLFNKMFATMEKEETKFAGCNPCGNTFFMKEGYSTNLRYTGGHLIAEIIREKEDRIAVTESHMEDYIANIEYFKKDKKLIRFNDVYVETKYYNPVGGICQQYGGLEERIKDAEKLAKELEVRYAGFAKAHYKKGSSRVPPCWNLRLNNFKKI